MGGVVIHYVARIRVGRRTIFALKLTTVGGVESVVVVGHC